MIATVRSSTPSLPPVVAAPAKPAPLADWFALDGFEPGANTGKLAAATVAGGALGSALIGFGTKYFTGPTEVLFGMVNGGFAGMAVGGVLGAAIASLVGHMGQDGEQSGSIGTALVGGALGVVSGAIGGSLAGAYLGHAVGNVLGFTAGAVVGGSAAYLVARRHLART